MVRWALFFLLAAVVAALFGFTGMSASAAFVAKWLFVIAIAAFIVVLVTAFAAGKAAF